MKKIIVGVSASVAIYKTCDLVRKFKREGYEIHVVMTEGAAKFISPILFESLSGNKVYYGVFDHGGEISPHIKLKEKTSLFVISPTTANILGKIANGIADDVLTTTFLAVDCPVLVAPAMNPDMWNHPAVQENVKKLKSYGVDFVEPESGKVVCNVSGKGRLAKTDEIFEKVVAKIG